MASSKTVVYVKGDPVSKKLGDCKSHGLLAYRHCDTIAGPFRRATFNASWHDLVLICQSQCMQCKMKHYRRASCRPPSTHVPRHAPDPNARTGPFCHRALLTFEAKKVPYDLEYIDFANKPAWLQEASGGKVPVIQEPGQPYMPDSDVIVVHLEVGRRDLGCQQRTRSCASHTCVCVLS